MLSTGKVLTEPRQPLQNRVADSCNVKLNQPSFFFNKRSNKTTDNRKETSVMT